MVRKRPCDGGSRQAYGLPRGIPQPLPYEVAETVISRRIQAAGAVSRHGDRHRARGGLARDACSGRFLAETRADVAFSRDRRGASFACGEP